MAKTYFNIFDMSGGSGRYIQTVEDEASAREICQKQKRRGNKYTYLESQEI